MAVTNFLVTGLPDYVENNRDIILKNFALVGTDTRRRIGLQTGIKLNGYLNALGVTPTFQDGSSCGFNPLDEIELSQKTLETAILKTDGQICPETLLGKWAEYQVRIAATENSLPFEGYIIDGLIREINKGIERLIWTADTGNSDPIDGFLAQFTADGNVVAVTLTGVAAAYDAVKAVYFNMSDEALDRGGMIFVDPVIFRALLNDLTVLNYHHYPMGNGNPDEILLPGTDVRVVKTPGLASTNAIVGTFPENLVYGTDMEGDNERVDLWWSNDDRVFKYQVKWNSGVAYHFSEHIAVGTMDAAPTPMGSCPCVAAGE